MNTNNLQQQLLEAVQAKFTKRQEMITVLSELFSVSVDGIYRRLRGDTLLAPDEIAILAKTFQISLDRILSEQSDTLLFSYNLLSNPVTDFQTYLKGIHQNLSTVSSIKGTQIYYASQEIPIFQYFPFTRLMSFKLYVYGLTSWNFESLKGQKFHLGLFDPELFKIGAECTRLYNQLDTKDLWSLNIVDNTLNQIEYLATVELFEDTNDALLICDEILQFIDNAKTMAAGGRKSLLKGERAEAAGVFDLYYNEMITTNNTILVLSSLGKMAFTTIIHPNFLRSTDQVFCNLIEDWFDMIMNRSTSISVHSAKSRDWYFNRLEKKVQLTKEKVKILQSA